MNCITNACLYYIIYTIYIIVYTRIGSFTMSYDCIRQSEYDTTRYYKKTMYHIWRSEYDVFAMRY